MINGIIFAILAMLSWGIADFLAKLAIGKYGLYRSFVYSYILGTLPLIIFYPFFFQPINDLSLILFFAIGAMFNFLGYFFFYKGMEKNEVSILSPIVACNSLIAVLLSIIFLKETLSFNYIVGIIIAVLGLFLVAMQTNLKFNKSAIYFGLLTMVFWGISLFSLGILARVSGWFLAALAYRFFSSIYSLNLLRQKADFKFKIDFLPLLLFLGLFDMLGTVFFNIGAIKEQLSIVSPVSTLYPAVTVILALIFLKEKLTNLQKVGIFAILLGLVIINL